MVKINITNELKKYLKGMLSEQFKIDWIVKQVENGKIKTQQEAEHMADYLAQARYKSLDRATYEQIKKKTNEWLQNLIKKGKSIKLKANKDYKIVKKYKNGFKFVKLISREAYEREGKFMRHCVASYYGKNDEIYSLWDRKNEPHCTISTNSQQIKGKGNGSIHLKYVKYVVDFLEYLGVDVRDSEMRNLGYYNIKKIRKYLSKETIKQLFKGKYWHESVKLIDKECNEFYDFELLDIKPLINDNIRINYDINKLVEYNIKNKSFKILNKINFLKFESSYHNSKLSSSYHNSKLSSSGDNSKLASSGYNSQLASSGDSSRLASSGNYSQLASSGPNSIIAGIGIDNIAKGVITNWIVLAEYDNEGKVKYVKSAKIDGKKLKPNVWYKLKKGKFVEVE